VAPRVAVINLDDQYGGMMEEAAGGVGKAWTYGKHEASGWTPRFWLEYTSEFKKVRPLSS